MFYYFIIICFTQNILINYIVLCISYIISSIDSLGWLIFISIYTWWKKTRKKRIMKWNLYFYASVIRHQSNFRSYVYNKKSSSRSIYVMILIFFSIIILLYLTIHFPKWKQYIPSGPNNLSEKKTIYFNFNILLMTCAPENLLFTRFFFMYCLWKFWRVKF